MRLVDLVARGGHLSERALTDAILRGDRPSHLDHCDICAERAEILGRWLDNVSAHANAAFDSAFPAERLAAQQSQVMRRLEQLDEPPRVIAFPHQTRTPQRESGSTRRIAPAWLGVAAAAGLVIGIIGGQASVRLEPIQTATVAPPAASPAPAQEIESAPSVPAGSWMDMNLDYVVPAALAPMDAWTPRAIGNLAQAGG